MGTNKKKVIALVLSDLHISDWSKFNTNNERTLNHIKVLSTIGKISGKHKCPVLFCGDLFHKPEILTNDLANLCKVKFSKLEGKLTCYAISGNHDLFKVNTIEQPQSSWVTFFENSWLKCIDFKEILISKRVKVHGVPYIDHNIGLNTYLSKLDLDSNYKNILMLHTDYPGAKDCDGRVIDSVENLNLNVLNRFDLVLCGHIHKPQRLGKKVYMIGAPLQQRRTDRDNDLGYWKLYEDLTMKFIPLQGFPKFIDVENEEDIKEDGNYYTLLSKKSSVCSNTKHKITKQLTKRSLAKKYLREKGIKDKAKKELLVNILKLSE